MEWGNVYRKIAGNEKEPHPEIHVKKKTPKFPSRERNQAIRRKPNNNNNSRQQCHQCAKVSVQDPG